MPPHASRRLNLVLVPRDWQAVLEEDALSGAWSSWVGEGFITAKGRPGPAAEDWVEGGFALLRVDRPPRIGVYGNRVGGFHVDCPECGQPVAREWGGAVQALKKGAPWALRCASCASVLQPGQVNTQPPAALARFALELRDVGDSSLRSTQAFVSVLGERFRVIATRG